MNITAKELSGLHLGKTITSPIGISGTIALIEQGEFWTCVHFDPPTPAGIQTLEVNHDTPINIQEEQ